jgi:hypothetical protein
MSVEEIERAQVLAAKYARIQNSMGGGVPGVGMDYCAEGYQGTIQPEPRIGTDAAEINSEFASLLSSGSQALGDLPMILPTYVVNDRGFMPVGGREAVTWGFRRGEGIAALRVTNQTKMPMRVLLRGAVSRVIGVSAGDGGEVRVLPGNYQIGVQLGAVRLYGEKTLSDQMYELSFSQRDPPATASPQDMPGSPSGATDIREEIDAIARSGRYAPMPNAQTGSTSNVGVSTATRILQNNTVYALHVLMSGPVNRKMDLLPGEATTVVIPPGSYRVAARVDSNTVLPFYGVETLEAGIDYTSKFYVK